MNPPLRDSKLVNTFYQNCNCTTKKLQLLAFKKSALRVFQAIFKKTRLLKNSSSHQKICNSKMKYFNFFQIGKKES